MPPYAGDFLFHNNNNKNATIASNAVPTAKLTESVTEDETSGSEKTGHFNALLDFNPCTTMSGAGHSMSSAMFKARPCTWCGKGCNKVNYTYEDV
jgi:hypothetical protein